MDKQDKAIKKIKHSSNSGQNAKHLFEIKKNPNDECYTSMHDILNEMSYWAKLDKFRNKNIICPCDWNIAEEDPNIYGIEITYKENSVETKVFKAGIEGVKLIQCGLDEKDIECFLCDKLACNFVRTLTQNARAWGINSITASGYNPTTDKGIKFQDIDYSKYDICVTNPPFSKYAEFMDCIVGKIDFIILAPFLNRTSPNVGLPLMIKQAYLGYNIQADINFNNPTIENKYSTKKVRCDWISSFSEAQEERNKKEHKTGIDYELYKDEYVVMSNMTMKDGTHPIRVPGSQIPDNYDGWMFSSINILDRISFDEYEWYGTNFMKYYNTTCPQNNPFAHKAFYAMLKVGDKQYFGGIVFRKKMKGENK